MPVVRVRPSAVRCPQNDTASATAARRRGQSRHACFARRPPFVSVIEGRERVRTQAGVNPPLVSCTNKQTNVTWGDFQDLPRRKGRSALAKTGDGVDGEVREGGGGGGVGVGCGDSGGSGRQICISQARIDARGASERAASGRFNEPPARKFRRSQSKAERASERVRMKKANGPPTSERASESR